MILIEWVSLVILMPEAWFPIVLLKNREIFRRCALTVGLYATKVLKPLECTLDPAHFFLFS